MAFSSGTIWEVDGVGGALSANSPSDQNGGGFDPSYFGADLSQNAPIVIGVGGFGVAISGTTATVVAHSTTLDKGNYFYIGGGAGLTAGLYQIVASGGGTWTLDRSAGTGIVTSGNLGGPLATPGYAVGMAVASNTIYCSGAFTTTTNSANVSGGILSISTGGSFGNPFEIIGYTATRGDGGQFSFTIGSGQTGPAISISASYTTILNFNGTTTNDTSSTGSVLSATNAANVIVQSSTLASALPNSSGSNGPYNCVLFQATTNTSTAYSGCSVTNCTISGGCVGLGIVGPSTSSDGFSGFTVGGIGAGNTIHDCSEYGIYCAEVLNTNNLYYNMVNPYIAYNTVFNISGDSASVIGSTGIGIALCNATCPSSRSRTTGDIEHNTIYNCGASSGQTGAGPVGLIILSAENVIVQNNDVSGIYQPQHTDGTGIDIDTSCINCTAQFNFVHTTAGSGLIVFGTAGGVANQNTWLRFNTVCGCGTGTQSNNQSCVATNGAPTGLLVYNNTLINGVYALGSSINTASATSELISNNIIQSYYGQACINSSGSATITGNFYDDDQGTFSVNYGGTSYSSIATFRSSTGQEKAGGSSGIVGQIQLVQPTWRINELGAANIPAMPYFTPTTGATVIGAGLNLNSLYSIALPSTDMSGNSLPGSGYNIGAYNVTYSGSFSPYDSAVLSSAPNWYYNLQDTSGTTATDTTGNSVTGTYTGVTLNQAGVAGSKSVLLAGASSSYISYPANLDGFSVMSAEIWINASANTAGTFVLGRWGSTGPTESYLIQLNGGNITAGIKGNNGGLLDCTTTGSPIILNAWYMVDIVWSAVNTLTIYVNGVARAATYGSQGSPNFMPSLTGSTIGYDPNGGAAFSGAVERASVYLYPLTATQISAHYTEGLISAAAWIPFPQSPDVIRPFAISSY
jgi:hypothetical protein